MWDAFFKLRSSTKFCSKCSDFLAKSIAVDSSPTCVCIFFQFVVDCVFDALIKHHYQVDMHKKEHFDISLTYEKQNALRYTSGYVVKGVLKKTT